jgi:hypothetical protein
MFVSFHKCINGCLFLPFFNPRPPVLELPTSQEGPPHAAVDAVDPPRSGQVEDHFSGAGHGCILATGRGLQLISGCLFLSSRSSTHEQADADFKILGVQMRGWHDFGVRKQDPRGAVKMA